MKISIWNRIEGVTTSVLGWAEFADIPMGIVRRGNCSDQDVSSP